MEEMRTARANWGIDIHGEAKHSFRGEGVANRALRTRGPHNWLMANNNSFFDGLLKDGERHRDFSPIDPDEFVISELPATDQ